MKAVHTIQKQIATSLVSGVVRPVVNNGTRRVLLPVAAIPLVWLKGPNISETIKRDYADGKHFDIIEQENGELDWDAPLDWDETLVWNAGYWVGTYSAPAADAELIAADSGILFLYDAGGTPVVHSQTDFLALNNNKQYFSVRRGFIAFPTDLNTADDLSMKAWL